MKQKNFIKRRNLPAILRYLPSPILRAMNVFSAITLAGIILPVLRYRDMEETTTYTNMYTIFEKCWDGIRATYTKD